MGGDYDPEWSPTSNKIAGDRTDQTVYVDQQPYSADNAEIYTINVDGSGLTNITNDPEGLYVEGDPDWSPDGKKITYGSVEATQGPQYDDGLCYGGGIYAMNADGTGKTRLTNTQGRDCFTPSTSDFNPHWSPDGAKIAFERSQEFDDSQEIWTVNSDGSGQTNLTDSPTVPDFVYDWGFYNPPPDTIAPAGTAKINGGAAYTRSASVNLSLAANDPAPTSGIASMRFINDGGTWSPWEPYAATKSWTLEGVSGTRSVYVQG